MLPFLSPSYVTELIFWLIESDYPGTVRLVRRTEEGKYGTVRPFEQYFYSLILTTYSCYTATRSNGSVSNGSRVQLRGVKIDHTEGC